MKREGVSYLVSVHVENARCFVDATLDLSDGEGRSAPWTVVLGENGRGKTTLLQATAALVTSTPSSSLCRRPQTRAQLTVRLEGGRTARWSLSRSSAGWMESWGVPPTGVERMPPLFAYGATRRASPATLSADVDNGSPVATLFDPEARLINAEEWLLRLDYSAHAAKTTDLRQGSGAMRDTVVAMLVDLLPDVEAIQILAPEDESGGRVRFHTPFGAVGLLDLGMGYQAMIAWIVDLAARLHRHYKDSPRPTAEPCIVLVDEIDLHLHPTWQRDIKDFLLTRFPGAQFIVTAHSPLMVQAALGENLAVLVRDGDAVRIENDPEVIEGWRVDQLLTSDLFGLTSARPPAVAELLDERTELVAQGMLTGPQKRRLAELDAVLGELPTAASVQDEQELRQLKALARSLAGKLASEPPAGPTDNPRGGLSPLPGKKGSKP